MTVTVTVVASAFNQNETTYADLPKEIREEQWRWRHTTSNFTLDIVSPWVDDEKPSPCGSFCHAQVTVLTATGVVSLDLSGEEIPSANLTDMVENGSSALNQTFRITQSAAINDTRRL